MKPIFAARPLAAAGALVLSLSNAAVAQLTLTGAGHGAPSASSVALAPFVVAIAPIVAPLVASSAGAAALWLCATLARWAGAKRAQTLDSGARAALAAAAEREALVLVAAASDNLAHRSISAGSPGVASAVSLIGAELPQAMKRLAITPEGVERLVLAALGRAQAGMTRVSPAP